jgi:hypothetical protein
MRRLRSGTQERSVSWRVPRAALPTRTVTFLFTDIEGSNKASARTDAVAAAEAGQAALPRAPYGFAWPLSSLVLSHAPATLGRLCSLRSSVRMIRSSSKEDSGHMRWICDGVLPGDER